jgi:hypothetical protein
MILLQPLWALHPSSDRKIFTRPDGHTPATGVYERRQERKAWSTSGVGDARRARGHRVRLSDPVGREADAGEPATSALQLHLRRQVVRRPLI